MNLHSPELSPDERIRRRLWLEDSVANGFLSPEDAESWGLQALVDGRIRVPRVRTYPQGGGIGEDDQNSIISLLQEGHNLSFACSRLDIPVVRVKKEISKNREFSLRVNAASECMEGFCTHLLAETVVRTRDPEMALKVLPRLSGLRNQSNEAEYRHKDYRIKLQLAKAQLRQVQATEVRDIDYDFSVLGKRDFERYTELVDVATSGQPMSHPEFSEFGQLVYQIIHKAAKRDGIETIDEGLKKLGYDDASSGGTGDHDQNGNGQNGHSNGNGYH